MKTKGIRKQVVEVDVLPLNFLIDLFKSEFLGCDIYDEFLVQDEKLYVYVDTSYQGGIVENPPVLDLKLITDDKTKVKKFIHIKELINLYK